MKRKILLFVLLLSSIVLAACKLDDGDDRDSFKQFVQGSNYVFPKGTTALELYNTFFAQGKAGDYTVTGTYKRTESAVLLGETKTVTKTETIKAVKIYRSRTEISNRFHVDFITNDRVLANYYSWQHHRSNVWHNNKIDGEITIPIF